MHRSKMWGAESQKGRKDACVGRQVGPRGRGKGVVAAQWGGGPAAWPLPARPSPGVPRTYLWRPPARLPALLSCCAQAPWKQAPSWVPAARPVCPPCPRPFPRAPPRPARGCSLLSRTGGAPPPAPGTPHKGGRGQATVPAGGSTCGGLCRPCLPRSGPWDQARKLAQGLSPGPGGDAVLGSDASSSRAQLCDLGQVTSPL